jgi:hypothetical protein
MQLSFSLTDSTLPSSTRHRAENNNQGDMTTLDDSGVGNIVDTENSSVLPSKVEMPDGADAMALREAADPLVEETSTTVMKKAADSHSFKSRTSKPMKQPRKSRGPKKPVKPKKRKLLLVPKHLDPAIPVEELACPYCVAPFAEDSWVCCTKCHQWHHPECYEPPFSLETLGRFSKNFTCANCAYCVTCESAEPEDLLMICEKCQRGFHTMCLDPPLPSVAQGDFFCFECRGRCDGCPLDDDLEISMDGKYRESHAKVLCDPCCTKYDEKSFCAICGRTWVADGWDDNWVQCDFCEMWVHSSCDVTLNGEQLSNIENTQYKCAHCNGGVSSLRSMAITKTHDIASGAVIQHDIFYDLRRNEVDHFESQPNLTGEGERHVAVLIDGTVAESHRTLVGEDVPDLSCLSPLRKRLKRETDVPVAEPMPPSENAPIMEVEKKETETEAETKVNMGVNMEVDMEVKEEEGVAAESAAMTEELVPASDAVAPMEVMARDVSLPLNTAPLDSATATADESDRPKRKRIPIAYSVNGNDSDDFVGEVTRPAARRRYHSRKLFDAQVQQALPPQSQGAPSSFPRVPFHVAPTLVVESWGEAIDNANFFSDRYVFPLGYRSRRLFADLKSNCEGEKAWYVSEIQMKEERPYYVVTHSQDPTIRYESFSSSACWQGVQDDLKRQSLMRQQNSLANFGKTSASGPDKFGLYYKEVHEVLEQWRTLLGYQKALLKAPRHAPHGSSGLEVRPQSQHRPTHKAAAPKLEVLQRAMWLLGSENIRPTRYKEVAPMRSGCSRAEPKRWNRRRPLVKPGHDCRILSVPSTVYVSAENKAKICHAPLMSWQLYSSSVKSAQRRLTVGKSSVHGWGLFAREFIRAGEFVLEYVGEIIRNAMADKRERMYKESDKDLYMFRCESDSIIDATERGSLCRLINHSCDPNCESKLINCDGTFRIFILCLADIAPGEELSYDYKISKDGGRIPCRCGAVNCRGRMN